MISGNNYVFRIIAATCLSCPFRFQIEGHKMVIIGTDGRDTEPQLVDSIEMAAGKNFLIRETHIIIHIILHVNK